MSTDVVMAAHLPARRPARLPARPRGTGGQLPLVSDVMTRTPALIPASASLFRAWELLCDGEDRHLVVVDDRRRPLGVIDERDLALEWPAGPREARSLTVHRLLRFRSRPRVRPGDDLATAARTLLGARVEAVPVVGEHGRVQGLLTVWHCASLVAALGDQGRGEVGSRGRIA